MMEVLRGISIFFLQNVLVDKMKERDEDEEERYH